MPVTAKQIAKKLGVSGATVSLALRGKPGVSQTTKQRVLAAAVEMGYSGPAVSAPKVVSTQRKDPIDRDRPQTICLVGYSKRRTFEMDHFSEMSAGVERVVSAAGMRLMFSNLDGDSDLRAQVLNTIRGFCDGIIVISAEVGHYELEAFSLAGVPLILLGSYIPNVDVDCITQTNRYGATVATQRLIANYEGIPGLMKSRTTNFSRDERADGYYMALREHGLPPAKAVVHVLGPTVEAARADMTAVLENGDPLARSYFADDDAIAIGAMQALLAHGLRIPEDVAIIGFGNSPAAPYVDPPLSTVHSSPSYMGTIAAQRMLRMLESDGDYEPLRIVTKATVMKRGSSA